MNTGSVVGTNLNYCNMICLNFLHSKAVGTLEPCPGDLFIPLRSSRSRANEKLNDISLPNI